MTTTTSLTKITTDSSNPAVSASLIKSDCLGRIHVSKEHREKLLDAFDSSGMSGVKFAAHYGIKYTKEWIDQSDHPPEAIIYYRRRYNRKLMKELRAKLHEFKPQHLPKSNMGKALTYAHNQWVKLCRTNKHSITLDNNRAENAVRPLKLGVKNCLAHSAMLVSSPPPPSGRDKNVHWLFIGREDTGWRSAVIFTIIENVRTLGYDPYEYLEWVFGKLPGMTHQDNLRPLLPKAWVEGKEQQKAQAEKDRQQEQKERLAS
jgi:hypothetical protein